MALAVVGVCSTIPPSPVLAVRDTAPRDGNALPAPGGIAVDVVPIPSHRDPQRAVAWEHTKCGGVGHTAPSWRHSGMFQVRRWRLMTIISA